MYLFICTVYTYINHTYFQMQNNGLTKVFLEKVPFVMAYLKLYGKCSNEA